MILKYPVEHAKGPKSASENRPKTVVPKDFIKKIKSLGLKEEDAEILYETKIDWTTVYSDNKIYCTEGKHCDYVTEMTNNNENLRNHLREAHQWGDWPCSNSNCGYIAHSKVSFQHYSCSMLHDI